MLFRSGLSAFRGLRCGGSADPGQRPSGKRREGCGQTSASELEVGGTLGCAGQDGHLVDPALLGALPKLLTGAGEQEAAPCPVLQPGLQT